MAYPTFKSGETFTFKSGETFTVSMPKLYLLDHQFKKLASQASDAELKWMQANVVISDDYLKKGPSAFGAVGDGITDDTAAIQAYMAAVGIPEQEAPALWDQI